MTRPFLVILMISMLFSRTPLMAQELTIEHIFNGSFYPEYSKAKKWVDNGDGYTILEDQDKHEGNDIVRYNTKTGKRKVLISSADLIPDGHKKPLYVENYEWSTDKKKLLIYTNTKRVWRINSRGDYWVKDLTDGRLVQLGKALPESSLMFAKFSRSGAKVAYVSKHNIYQEDLVSGELTQLTTDGSNKMINGTFDWAYEEEFGCRDGFRWSDDENKIAFWQIDASGIGDFLMINNTDSVYSKTIPVQYPKVGYDNSACKVGVIDIQTKAITWMKVPGDLKNNYIPRMQWAANSQELIIQRMNRNQNHNQVMLCDINTGESRTIYEDKDEKWVDAVDDWKFLNEGSHFTWVSQKNGWKGLYKVSRDGKKETLLSPDDHDMIDLQWIDETGQKLYYTASPANATQRYLFHTQSSGEYKQITPADQPGTHSYNISPDGKWAFHSYSRAGVPHSETIVSLPDHKEVRTIVANDKLKAKLAALNLAPIEFGNIKNDEGIPFDYYLIKPTAFDSDKQYPVLFYVYGEPAGQTVLDKWGGDTFLYHQRLAQAGYVVMSIDSRGTPAPKGREWRKSIHAKLGVISSKDQAEITQKLLQKYTFLDETRVGIWGWSGGGSMTLNALFRYPDLYKTGVSVAPVTDISLYDNIYQERYCGLIWEKEEAYYQSSPVNFAKNLKGELLLIHGTGDDNVHYQNSEILINELIRTNKMFSFMSYPNRSHAIWEGENTRNHLFQTMFNFIVKNL